MKQMEKILFEDDQMVVGIEEERVGNICVQLKGTKVRVNVYLQYASETVQALGVRVANSQILFNSNNHGFSFIVLPVA